MSICALSYDVYLVCEPGRERPRLAEALSTVAGTRLHQETHVWNPIGQCPEDIAHLGPEVRSMDGIKVPGTPLGSAEFVSSIKRKGKGGTEVVGGHPNRP